MSTDIDIRECIHQAAETVGPAWPLHSFVTANPLRGFEDRPFHEAVQAGEQLFDARGYPGADVFRHAWQNGQIDTDILVSELTDHGYELPPDQLLERMAGGDETRPTDPAVAAESSTDRVDHVLTKWLSIFFDQGKAHWPMPNRDAGFYAAVRRLLPHDSEIPNDERLLGLPEDPVASIETVLAEYPDVTPDEAFEYHLAALPGWTGFIRQRVADEGPWQSKHPVTLSGYLAIRLALADALDAPMCPADNMSDSEGGDEKTAVESGTNPDCQAEKVPLPEVWLSAWEATYRDELVDAIADASANREGPTSDGRPDAQLVFCIDTRSEIIRRHVEAAGDYETHGYAGFFGIPMRYDDYTTDVTVDACPPILDAEHRIADRPAHDREQTRNRHEFWATTVETGREIVDALKTNAATAFSFVETAGLGYGAVLTARTLLPARVYDIIAGTDEHIPSDHEFCAPTVDYDPDADSDLQAGLTLDQKVEYAGTAFELMGVQEFGRLFVFAGHASQTANNPFDSSLDCGACAGNPGGPSARVLAAICNDEEVRARLRDRGIDVPEDTVFVPGEHNTTTDEITLYDSDVPASHEAELEQLRADLARARAGAASERAVDMGADVGSGVRETERRAADWAETRPEWGLAGNAGFVIGPRALTEELDLDGRSFLHSYDWATDPDGDALEAIMTGPMVVTQWINTQYYFATVDNAVYGSGSKVTQNPVGNIGVYQGNSGDLMTGLPLESLMAVHGDPYHQPLRLSTFIHAPVKRVTAILADHDELTRLLDNNWLSLTVVDPQQGHTAFHYDSDLTWTPARDQTPTSADARGAFSVTDDSSRTV